MAPEIPTDVRDALALADAKLFHGLQLGLWVDRGPTMEECIALSSICQDELGHARALLDAVASGGGPSVFALQYDRAMDDFGPPAAALVPRPDWPDNVVAMAVTDRLMLHALRALPAAAPILAKLEQEEAWHMHHADAWLQSLGHNEASREALQGAIDRLWPAVAQWLHGWEAAARDAALDELSGAFEAASVTMSATKGAKGWTIRPEPSGELDAAVEALVGDQRVELVAMVQDPTSRAIAEAFEKR